jgi:hypothetical protein
VGRRWVEAEEEAIRKLWAMQLPKAEHTQRLKELAQRISRSPVAVVKRAEILRCPLRVRPWTHKEIACLRSWYGSADRKKLGLAVLARRLGRTAISISDKAMELGISKTFFAWEAPENFHTRLRSWHRDLWSMQRMSRFSGIPGKVIKRWLLSLGLVPHSVDITQYAAAQRGLERRRRRLREDGYHGIGEELTERRRAEAYFCWPGAETKSECDVLDVVSQHDGALVRDVASKTGLSPGGASRILRNLTRRKMLVLELRPVHASHPLNVYRLGVDTLPYNEHHSRMLDRRIPKVKDRDRDYCHTHRMLGASM